MAADSLRGAGGQACAILVARQFAGRAASTAMATFVRKSTRTIGALRPCLYYLIVKDIDLDGGFFASTASSGPTLGSLLKRACFYALNPTQPSSFLRTQVATRKRHF